MSQLLIPSVAAGALIVGGSAIVYHSRRQMRRFRERMRAFRESESERRYRLLFEQNPLPTWVYDTETHRFLAVNAAAVAHYGFTREEFLAMTIFDICFPEDVPALTAALAEPSLSHTSYRRTRHRRKDNSVIDVDVAAHVVTWDGRPARLVLATDVTGRMRAERELRQAHEMVTTLLDAAPVAIVAIDMESRVTMWNRSAESLFGWTADEVLGAPLPIIAEESREEFARLRRELILGRRTEAYETRRRRKDGSLVDVYISAAPLTNGAGEVDGGVALFLDVTERRRLEEQLRQSQKLEAVGQLAGGVAHDFNNLLTVIRVNCEFLTAEAERRNSPSDEIAEIRGAAERAAALTRQLLAFSRKQILQPRIVDAAAVTAGIAPMLRRLLGEDIEVVLESRGDTRVLADPGQLEQVLVNLGVNARDAMPHGGRLTIETRLVELDEHYAEQRHVVVPGYYVMLAVSDTGSGMDRTTREHVFEPFFTTKEPGRGTGLGLSTVYGIVRQSGGYIWVYSEPGQGTTFKIYLPRELDDTEPGELAEAVSPMPHGSESVLVVEDQEGIRTLARRVLGRQGYRVLEARHGADALQLVSETGVAVDLLLTDIVMPTMGGRALVDCLRAQRPELRVLYMSGYTESEMLRRGLWDGCAPFLQKPFTAHELARAVRSALDGHAIGCANLQSATARDAAS
ncbi:MAG TPA: PAS domain S-box protein [Gemmatimonadaceae bacterium]